MKRVNILFKLEMNSSDHTLHPCCRCACVLRLRLQPLCVLTSLAYAPSLAGVALGPENAIPVGSGLCWLTCDRDCAGPPLRPASA